MAEKILNTRILMKIDTLEAWKSSTLKLKEGELAFATAAVEAGTGLSEPVVMVKIGTAEEKTFAELPWAFHAKASDVLAACKSEDALNTYIKNRLTAEGVATTGGLSDLAQRVTTAEGEIDTLQSEMDAVEAKASANETAIGTLNGLVGDKAVATQISDAINALSTVYAAKSLEKTVSDHVADTVAHVTSEDKIKWNNALQATDVVTGSANGTISVKGSDVAVKGLGSAAYTEASAYDVSGAAATAESNAKAYAKEYADGLAGNYDAKGAAATAESNAKAYAKEYADGLAGNYDAAGSATAAEAAAKKHADDELTRLVGDKTVGTQISEAITGLDLANTYAAKSHKHEIADVNGLQNALDGKEAAGAAATAEANAKQYTDDLASWVSNTVYAEANKASGLAGTAVRDAGLAQADVDKLEAYVGTFTHDTAKSVVEYINAKTAGITSDATELAGRVTTAEGEIDALQADLNTAETGLKAKVAALEELVGDEKVSEAIAAAVKVEEDRAKAAEKANADAIALLNNNAETAGSVDYKIAQAVAGIMQNPDDTMNSINELVTWTNEHAQDALEMSNQVTANKNAIATLNGDATTAGSVDKKIADAIAAENLSQYATDGELTAVDNRLKAVETAVGETGSVATAIAGAVTEAKGYADAEIKKLADGAVATNAADIDALEEKVGDKKVSEQITAITNPLDERIDALEAIDHSHANAAELDKFVDGDKAKLDSAVQTVTAAATSGLKATRTGNDIAIEIDESVTFIFDCGTSAV